MLSVSCTEPSPVRSLLRVASSDGVWPKPLSSVWRVGQICGAPHPWSAAQAEQQPLIPKQEMFCFCRTPTCEAVYFLPDRVLFQKQDLSVPVGLKEFGNADAPVCYCFGWTPQKILAEIEATGTSSAIEQIKAQVKAGNCYCEVTNPQGACCLGNVANAIEHTNAESSKGRR